MNDHAPPPQAVVFQMITGSWVAQALGAVARLSVADHLAAGPKTSAELAKAVGANTESLARTLRALAGVGPFTSPAPDSWALTPIGDVLRTDAPGSMRYAAIAEADHATGRPGVASRSPFAPVPRRRRRRSTACPGTTSAEARAARLG